MDKWVDLGEDVSRKSSIYVTKKRKDFFMHVQRN